MSANAGRDIINTLTEAGECAVGGADCKVEKVGSNGVAVSAWCYRNKLVNAAIVVVHIWKATSVVVFGCRCPTGSRVDAAVEAQFTLFGGSFMDVEGH